MMCTEEQLKILKAVIKERARQDVLKAAGRFPTTPADDMSEEMRLSILAEEFGEVAKAVCDDDEKGLRAELIQVAAVCVAWLEACPERPSRAACRHVFDRLLMGGGVACTKCDAVEENKA